MIVSVTSHQVLEPSGGNYHYHYYYYYYYYVCVISGTLHRPFKENHRDPEGHQAAEALRLGEDLL